MDCPLTRTLRIAAADFSTMKTFKATTAALKAAAHGDTAGVKELAKEQAAKIKSKAASAARKATGGSELIDPSLKAAHKQIVSLQAAHADLTGSLLHQVKAASKMSKAMHETSEGALHDLTSVVSPVVRRSIHAAMATEEALARAHEEYAAHLETAVLGPSRQEVGALSGECEALYSAYLATINELAAKQGKEQVRTAIIGVPKDATALASNLQPLLERKAEHEAAKLPRLTAIAEAIEAALMFTVAQHRLLQAAFLRGALSAAASVEGGSPMDDVAAVLSKTRAGWSELKAASGSSAAYVPIGRGLSGGMLPPPPPPPAAGRLGGSPPLEVLAQRADAVHGVPWVVHALMARLESGLSRADQTPLRHAEGLFRISASADRCEALRRLLETGAPDAALAAIDAEDDAHVLATTLKQW